MRKAETKQKKVGTHQVGPRRKYMEKLMDMFDDDMDIIHFVYGNNLLIYRFFAQYIKWKYNCEMLFVFADSQAVKNCVHILVGAASC